MPTSARRGKLSTNTFIRGTARPRAEKARVTRKFRAMNGAAMRRPSSIRWLVATMTCSPAPGSRAGAPGGASRKLLLNAPMTARWPPRRKKSTTAKAVKKAARGSDPICGAPMPGVAAMPISDEIKRPAISTAANERRVMKPRARPRSTSPPAANARAQTSEGKCACGTKPARSVAMHAAKATRTITGGAWSASIGNWITTPRPRRNTINQVRRYPTVMGTGLISPLVGQCRHAGEDRYRVF